MDYPSLEFCKQLKEVNFPPTREYNYEIKMVDGIPHTTMIVRPSIGEMLDVMPSSIDEYKRSPMLSLGKDWCKYESYAPDDPIVQNQQNEIFSDTLPNDLTEMILWLHQNNYISFPS